MSKDESHDLEHPAPLCHSASGRPFRLAEDRKLTVTEAAKMMGISSTSLRRLIREGRIPVLNYLHKVLILESDLEQFLRESRVTVRPGQDRPNRLPALPAAVVNSRHLR